MQTVLCRRPSTSNLNPFCQTTPVLALDVYDICIAFAAAANAVLFDGIKRLPILVFLLPLLLVCRRHLQERGSG